ncbi:MAG: diguanylate cyclase [Oscillospiraceae bacterium]|nr:diguanylate cyclase [Oscillospiraceae bacterium]
MKEKIREIRDTLNRSIFVGERYERNIQNMLVESYIVIVLGVLMVLVNILQKDYRTMIAPLAFVILSVLDIYFLKVRNSRRFSVIVTILAIIVIFTYCILFVPNGFAFLWTLLIPLSVCYMYGVKEGIWLSAYFQALYMIAFYTPVRQSLESHFTPIILDRFPILYFFNALITCYVMYQYHKSALFEIDHTNRLNEEVERQTAVAEERSRRIEKMSLQTIETLANAIDAKDPYTKGHSSRVSQYSVKIAEALGWPEQRVNDLRYAALLHDIGKIGVPDSILNNPKRLTEAEYDIIKSHTTTGAEILRNKIMIATAEDVALSHHERYDGTGYPLGKKGTEISEEARIVAIADAFDAMSSNRVYRRACEEEHIRKELLEGRGTQFDPGYTDILLDLWDHGQLDEIIGRESADTGESEEASSTLLQTVLNSFITQSSGDNTDLITGVLVRSAGEAAIARMMKETEGCFVFFDVDNLKKINDISGHKAGDKVLKMMGDTLNEYCGDGICCRLGGDEFLMFLKDVSREEAEETVRKVIRTFEEKSGADRETAEASLSAGLAMSTPADAYMKIFNQADKALYHVKQNGKRDLGFYNVASESYREEELDMNKLIRAIRTSGSYDGAMDVEYRQFAQLYEYIENLEKRYSQPFKLIMIKLEPLPGTVPHTEELEISMYFMEQAIRQTVRGVDVVTRYSRHQFLIILLGTDDEGVRTAMERIFRGYYKMNGSNAFSPSYSVADPGES